MEAFNLLRLPLPSPIFSSQVLSEDCIFSFLLYHGCSSVKSWVTSSIMLYVSDAKLIRCKHVYKIESLKVWLID